MCVAFLHILKEKTGRQCSERVKNISAKNNQILYKKKQDTQALTSVFMCSNFYTCANYLNCLKSQ